MDLTSVHGFLVLMSDGLYEAYEAWTGRPDRVNEDIAQLVAQELKRCPDLKIVAQSVVDKVKTLYRDTCKRDRRSGRLDDITLVVKILGRLSQMLTRSQSTRSPHHHMQPHPHANIPPTAPITTRQFDFPGHGQQFSPASHHHGGHPPVPQQPSQSAEFTSGAFSRPEYYRQDATSTMPYRQDGAPMHSYYHHQQHQQQQQQQQGWRGDPGRPAWDHGYRPSPPRDEYRSQYSSYVTNPTPSMLPPPPHMQPTTPINQPPPPRMQPTTPLNQLPPPHTQPTTPFNQPPPRTQPSPLNQPPPPSQPMSLHNQPHPGHVRHGSAPTQPHDDYPYAGGHRETKPFTPLPVTKPYKPTAGPEVGKEFRSGSNMEQQPREEEQPPPVPPRLMSIHPDDEMQQMYGWRASNADPRTLPTEPQAPDSRPREPQPPDSHPREPQPPDSRPQDPQTLDTKVQEYQTLQDTKAPLDQQPPPPAIVTPDPPRMQQGGPPQEGGGGAASRESTQMLEIEEPDVEFIYEDRDEIGSSPEEEEDASGDGSGTIKPYIRFTERFPSDLSWDEIKIDPLSR